MKKRKGRGEGARSAYALNLIKDSKLTHAGRVTNNNGDAVDANRTRAARVRQQVSSQQNTVVPPWSEQVQFALTASRTRTEVAMAVS